MNELYLALDNLQCFIGYKTKLNQSKKCLSRETAEKLKMEMSGLKKVSNF